MSTNTKIDDVAKIEVNTGKKNGNVKVDFDNKKLEKGIDAAIDKLIAKNLKNVKKVK